MSLPSQYERITARAVTAMVLQRLDSGPVSWIGDLAMRTTSDQASESYGWLGAAPALREFIGGRTPTELRELGFVITNKDYEGSFKVKVKDLRRDKTGMLRIRANQLADRAADHPAKLLSTLILAGEATTCYDGQYFFDTDHAEGDSGTQSNDIGASAVSATAPTVDEFTAAVVKSMQQILTFKDDRGEPINQSARQFLVMVPVVFLGTAIEAVSQLLGTGGKTATLAALRDQFAVNVVANPRLTWTTKFATFRTDDAAKPFILQEEQMPETVTLDENSEFAKINGECLFGIDWAGNVGFGYWQHACLTTFS